MTLNHGTAKETKMTTKIKVTFRQYGSFPNVREVAFVNGRKTPITVYHNFSAFSVCCYADRVGVRTQHDAALRLATRVARKEAH